MSIGWRDLAFQPDPDTARDAAAAWAWLVPPPWTQVLCSMIGGIFLEKPDGTVHWLDTGTGMIEPVAGTRAEFEAALASSPDRVEEWFLPGLVERLHAAGKRPADGQCFGFTILPIFREGGFESGNMRVVPVREQLLGTAEIHRQLSALPDGTRVRFKVVDWPCGAPAPRPLPA